MKKSRRGYMAFCFILFISLSLSAVSCSTTTGPETIVVTEIVEGEVVEKIITATPSLEEAEAPDTLVVLSITTPPALDPDIWSGYSWMQLMVNVYESVLAYEMVDEAEAGIPDGILIDGVEKINGAGDEGVVGNFFESWEIVDDQTVIFHVREGYKSYWGNQATADDWIWRVERAFALGAVGDFQLSVMGITGPDDVEKIDDMTIKMHTPNGPNPVFFKGLCVPVLVAFDVKAMKEQGAITEDDPWATEALKQQDFGYGPYHVADFVPGSYLKLEANPYYWKGEPAFKYVQYQEVPESSNRMAMLWAGEGHIAIDLTLLQKHEFVGGKGEAVYVGLPETNMHFGIQANRTWGAFSNLDCYHALGYAIPYEQIQETAYFGFGKVMKEAMVPIFGETVNAGNSPYYYDIDKAEELWTGGNCPATWTLTFAAEYPHYEDVGILLRTEFAKFGVNVVLDKQPDNVVSAKRSARELEALMEEGSAFVADAGYNAWLEWHKDSFDNVQAWYDEVNEGISSQIDQAMAMPSGPERTALLHEMQDVFVDQGGRMNILIPGWHLTANKHIRGHFWYASNVVHWADLYWE